MNQENSHNYVIIITDDGNNGCLLVVLQGAVQAGHVKVPPGYHPFDVEKEWGRLHVAILERERLLRTEFERQVRKQCPGAEATETLSKKKKKQWLENHKIFL